MLLLYKQNIKFLKTVLQNHIRLQVYQDFLFIFLLYSDHNYCLKYIVES